MCTIPIEGIFFFGHIMGFSILAEILKQLGVYESVCDVNDIENSRMSHSNESFGMTISSSKFTNYTVINCNERDSYFSTAATLGSVAMNVCTLPLGLIFDKYGAFWAR